MGRIEAEAVAGWFLERGRGVYGEVAIEICLTLRVVFGLGLRQTEGFVCSIVKLMGLDVPVADHTTLSRWATGLGLVKRKVPRAGAIDIVVDRTGLRIHSPGEWLGARHGGASRRKWPKLHLGLDPNSGELVAQELTPNDMVDPSALPDLLDQVKVRIGTFLAASQRCSASPAGQWMAPMTASQPTIF